MCTSWSLMPWSIWLVTDCVLRDLLRLQAAALEHVLEVHVAAEVQLVRVVDRGAAVFEQAGERAVHDRGADLALDVVADDRHAGVGELLGPLGIGRDEHRDRVDEGDPGVEARLGVVLLRLLAADREVGHEHVDPRVAQRLRDVDRLGRRLFAGLAVELAEAVERGGALHGDAEVRHVAELDGVVLPGEDRLAGVDAHLVGVDIERRHELDVADVVAAELDVHQTGHALVRVGVLVELDALEQRARAVADTSDGETNRFGAHEGASSIARPRSPAISRSSQARSCDKLASSRSRKVRR